MLESTIQCPRLSLGTIHADKTTLATGIEPATALSGLVC